jgi:hypothetical protein
MPMFLLASLLVVQAPAAAPPQPAQPIEVTQKKKSAQVCKVVEITGSRMRQRVCRDEFGKFDLGPGVTDAAPNPGVIHAMPGPAKGGFGGVPQ